MPLGWERINVKKTAPNKNIVFIKPRPGDDEQISRDFLERIAAQCSPIMNKNSLLVTSLEEYEPNREFWGRNFNGGEVIQLVLRSPSTGQWLPFKFVQMVMMHELAHNRQMNHSAAFHKVRIGFTNEMKELWNKGYTGDGLWGRGVLLENGAFARAELSEGEILPDHLCGGIFKSRGSRKRKPKPKITWKEAKERRIRKKFGTNGVALGADDEVKANLERGKKLAGKPRVAGSNRGRDLRAAAALARFNTPKEDSHLKDEDLVTDSETESDSESNIFIKTEPQDAVDIDGSSLYDQHGLPLVKVCEDEDRDDENAKNELLELQGFDGKKRQSQRSKHLLKPKMATPKPKSSGSTTELSNSHPSVPPGNDKLDKPVKEEDSSTARNPKSSGTVSLFHTEKDPSIAKAETRLVQGTCQVCSMQNESSALTCVVCSNVLRPEYVPGYWRCKISPCISSGYLNAGDVRRCGVCDTRKCSESI